MQVDSLFKQISTQYPEMIPDDWKPLVEILNKPLDTLQDQLDAIPNANKTCKIGKSFLTLNRYTNVFPYDENRVTLDEGRYINASRVELTNLNCLVASAPREHTLADWWEMIIKEECQLIAAATNTYEWRRERLIQKCTPYWESSQNINNSLDEGWKCLSITKGKVIDSRGLQKLVQRIITLQGPEEKVRKLTHLHFENWPDSGVAHISLAMKFHKLIKEKNSKKQPAVVHCSAGIGRSGTILAINEVLESEKPPDVMTIIEMLREQRAGMVQSATQVKMIARAALIILNAKQVTS